MNKDAFEIMQEKVAKECPFLGKLTPTQALWIAVFAYREAEEAKRGQRRRARKFLAGKLYERGMEDGTLIAMQLAAHLMQD